MKRLFTQQNIFLFITIVILPVCVTFYSVNSMIDEQYQAEEEAVSSDLRHQVARIEQTSTLEYQLKDFFTTMVREKLLCRQKPEVLRQFVDSVEEAYPDAFKWLFLDESYEIIPIKGKGVIEASKLWKTCLRGGIYVYDRMHNIDVDKDHEKIMEQYISARNTLGKMIGNGQKPEHLFESPFTTTKSRWLGKECYIIWGTDVATYNQFGVAKEITGGCLLMVIPELLPSDFWVKRMVVRRKKAKEQFKYPIAAINISRNTALAMDKALPDSDEFLQKLIKAYNSRSKEVFEFEKYIVSTSPSGWNSGIRVLSLADLTDLKASSRYMKLMLALGCGFLVILSSVATFFAKEIRFAGISLRQRIAGIFILAMLLPIISLIGVGKTFITHESGRLKESAYVKMRANLEALAMHYLDTPRLIEEQLFNDLLSRMPKGKCTVEAVSLAMNSAIEDKVINQFILFRDGEIIAKSWKGMEPTLEKTLKYMSRKSVKDYVGDKTVEEKGNKKLLEEFVDDEIKQFADVHGAANFSLSLPSHLRHFVYVDQHLYFMIMKVEIEGIICPLYVYLPDKLIEQKFAAREFVSNNSAAQASPGSLFVPELSFFSTSPGSESYPAESPLWIKLKETLERSADLKIEETGLVSIEDEDFLYLTKPLNSMNTKAYLPCLVTSVTPINLRIREMGLMIFSLSSLAVLGSILLSFALSSSLLTPIKTIDSAAQRIGNGDLDVSLPEDGGHDELSRLSITFNEMVKGLREREKMQAYVSDSVLEAVKDNGDQSVHAGKQIEATILFSDIRNFTGLSESNPPDKVFEVLNEHFGGIEPIIRMNHGRVDKYIGDAVMAVFHNTIPEHHAISAIKTAVKINMYVSMMNKRRIAKGLFPINIGVGISTGNVLLGDIGSTHRKDLTVIGDEVNLASRLESASKQGKYSKIIFSGQTLKYVEDFVEVVKMPFEEIRGKKQAVQIYELVKLKDSNFGVRE